jgi:uncharacterized YccA/Bax inhibitor family protein
MSNRGSSPALTEKIFERAVNNITEQGKVMTVNGTVNKTFILLLLMFTTAMYTWTQFFTGDQEAIFPLMIGGVITGLVLAIIMMFKMQWAFVLAPAYALAEGLFIGGISAIFSSAFEGIVMQAAGLTFGLLFVMLALYKFRIIKVTQKLRSGIIAATGAVALFYLVMLVAGLFGADTSFYASSSPLSIGLSLVIVGVATFNLLLDFDFIETGAKMGAPRYMEWYGAFALLVTLVWLYIEILRLLSKLRD